MPQEIQLNQSYSLQVKPAIPAVVVTFNTLKIDVIDNLVDEVNAKVWIDGVEDPYLIALWNKDTPVTYAMIEAWDNSAIIARVIEVLNFTTT